MPPPCPHRDRRLTRTALVLATLLAGCRDAPGPLFEERGHDAGIDTVLTCGEVETKPTILEVNGNGAALTDLDGDGDLDLVLVDGSTREAVAAGRLVRHHVLLNQGPRDGVPRFTTVEDDTGLVMSGWPTGITVGDVDQDGRPDLFIGGQGEDALFLNRTQIAQDGAARVRFEKRPLPGRDSPLDWTTSLACADVNGDGLLDLYLVRYLLLDPASPPVGDIDGVPCRFKGHSVLCGPHGLPPQPDVLLLGSDREGGFTDASVPSGIRSAAPAYGLGIALADLDGDGLIDVYVANDSVDNTLLHNLGDGRFRDVSLHSGAAADLSGQAQAGMGVDVGDMDGDGTFDIAVTNFSDETNAIYRRIGPMQFRDVNAAAGVAHVSRTRLGWGVQLQDFDADGDLDLFVANGHVFPEADLPDTGTSYAQPQQLFPGAGDGTFGADVFPDPHSHKGRCALKGDVDGDGDLDLLVLTLDGAPLLYLNRTDEPARQMLVTVRDGPRDAFGAVVTLQVGNATLTRQKVASSSFQGSPDPRLHFGGGGRVSSATVRWPGGELDTLDAERMLFGQHLIVERGRGVVAAHPLEPIE